MKITDSGTAKPRLSLHTIIFRAAAGLFCLMMLSVYLVCGMFAKYVVSGGIDDSAHVQGGAGIINVLEHEAMETGNNSGMYMLDQSQEVPANTYHKVLPGVDIPKDPFIRLTGLTDTVCELYVQVTESEDFPESVSYVLDTDVWENLGDGVYKYLIDIDSSVTDDIYILQNNQLNVGEHYVGNGGFTLTFSAWLVQKGEN